MDDLNMRGVSACTGHPPALYDASPGLEPISTRHLSLTRDDLNLSRRAGKVESFSSLVEGLGRTSRSGVISTVPSQYHHCTWLGRRVPQLRSVRCWILNPRPLPKTPARRRHMQILRVVEAEGPVLEAAGASRHCAQQREQCPAQKISEKRAMWMSR